MYITPKNLRQNKINQLTGEEAELRKGLKDE